MQHNRVRDSWNAWVYAFRFIYFLSKIIWKTKRGRQIKSNLPPASSFRKFPQFVLRADALWGFRWHAYAASGLVLPTRMHFSVLKLCKRKVMCSSQHNMWKLPKWEWTYKEQIFVLFFRIDLSIMLIACFFFIMICFGWMLPKCQHRSAETESVVSL